MENSSLHKKRNHTLDCLKLFAAYMVIFIHVSMGGHIGSAFNALARFAVPIFFISAGYFACNDDPKRIVGKIKRLLIMFLSSAAFYFVWRVVFQIYKTGDFSNVLSWIVQSYCWENIINLFLFNNTISSEHLWFFPALIYTYALQWIIKTFKINQHMIYILAIVFLLIHLFFGELSGIHGICLPSNIYIRNFLCFGFPFFVCGSFIKENEDFIVRHLSLPRLLIIIFIGVAEIALSIILFDLQDLYMGAILMAVSSFIIAIKYKDLNIPNIIKKMTKYSTFIYIFHPLIGELVRLIPENSFVKFMGPFIVILCTTILAIIVSILLNIIKKAVKSFEKFSLKLL